LSGNNFRTRFLLNQNFGGKMFNQSLIVFYGNNFRRTTLRRFPIFLIFILSFLFALNSCEQAMTIETGQITIEFDSKMHSRVFAVHNEPDAIGSFSASEVITIAGKSVSDFAFKSKKSVAVNDKIGHGTQYTFIGEAADLRKTITATRYDKFPAFVVYSVAYTNLTDQDMSVDGWINNQYHISAQPAVNGNVFWSYQSGSYDERPDWVLPVNPGFKQKNYMGMNSSDYGGGTPISDIWHKDAGIAVGHLETVPKLVSLPVEMPGKEVAVIGVHYDKKQVLKSGESLTTFTTFVAVHKGDYYAVLDVYRQIMEKRGVSIDPPIESAYEPIWCAWGYERKFKLSQVLNTLPKVKELGFKWAVLDDGWQTAEGDWYLMKKKFPRGDKDMKKFVDKIHSYGLKAKLWWAPLAVDPGTDLIKEHPEYLLLNEDGSKQLITWWNSYYLCPAVPEVQEFTKNQVKTFMKTWGYDGLKIDGQHLNGAPPCYNPAHNHERPEEGFEKIPEFFKAVYDAALEIKPEAVVEICPCGTAYSFFNLPYMNQPVSSDPTSSWQIRLKGKTLKGLMGPSAAYYGDHVELSDEKSDFASSVGVGAVIGTKFTWPVGAHMNRESGDVSLTAEKEVEWKKWVDIYQDKMLPKGTYLGSVYDIGFDKPETHVIQKDEKLYYAFYADDWDGDIVIKGLNNRSYKLLDYVNDKDYGTVKGPVGKINASFSKFLLLEATPD
jgi:alpha-galactosidase